MQDIDRSLFDKALDVIGRYFANQGPMVPVVARLAVTPPGSQLNDPAKETNHA